ncbi:MAG: Hpt domain-containing protein [Rhodospirillales bacterium]|nr:Hpt domain-containing protein [Rhodospirillales bacterium]
MANSKFEIINPPNTLKSKVSVGGTGAVDPAALERAESVIAGMAGDYLRWVQEDIVKIGAEYERLVSGQHDRKEVLSKIFQVAHQMKGQGGSFGYSLLTSVGNELCRIIEKMGTAGKTDLENEVIRIHIDSMKLVIASKMQGDGGKVGEAIMTGIRKVCDKLTQGA